MSNIKVVTIGNVPQKKTKKRQNNQDLDYLKNIIRKQNPSEPKKPKQDLNKILSKNEEIEKLLSKRNFTKKRNIEEKPTMEMEKPTMEMEKPTMILEKPKMVMEKPKMVMEKPKMVMEKPKKQEGTNIAPFTFTVNKKVENKVVNQKVKNNKPKLPKSITNLKPATKKDLNKFFKKLSKKKKTISSDIVAPKLKKSTKKSNKKSLQKKPLKKKTLQKKNIISSDHSLVNPFTKVIQKAIKKNSNKLDKDIDKLSRTQLINKLVKLELISKNTNAPLNILKDIYKIYKITDNISIKK